MDYFSVIVLILVTFVFISDRNTKSMEKIKSENSDIIKEVKKIKLNTQFIRLPSKDLNYENILKAINTVDEEQNKEYIVIQSKELNLSKEKLEVLIANFFAIDKRPSGFNLLYNCDKKVRPLKRIYIDIINYLNIFNKKELATFGVIVCKREDLKQQEKNFKRNLISYTPSEITNIQIAKEKINTVDFRRVCIKKISKSNLAMIIKIMLLIISGSIITTNLVYNILNINNNINSLIISVVIYYCYLYIIRYIYKPIGKQRIIATYIFPLYFIAYLAVAIYTLGTKVIKKVQAS